ncbi:UNVERIFIED_CONTAM: hypothetical protein NCL1_34961 [Trichonephila clavipes]
MYILKKTYTLIAVTRHVNTENPQAQSSNEVANPNAVEPEDAPTCNLERYFETMQERLDNMERRLCRIYDEGMDVIDTLEALEDKVLYLERLALELLNLPIPVPMEYITEEDSSEEDTSDDDITEEEINEAENIFKSFDSI